MNATAWASDSPQWQIRWSKKDRAWVLRFRGTVVFRSRRWTALIEHIDKCIEKFGGDR